MSQRLILALGPTLVRDFAAQGELRDITQAYTQSQDTLTRTIIARLPVELQDKYPPETVLWIRKPLYGLAESGLYWYKTYHAHHTKGLKMSISTYDPCLLHTTEGPKTFGITGMQTDDTLSFATKCFSREEEKELARQGFRAKPKTVLTEGQSLEFNGGRIQLSDGNITFAQELNRPSCWLVHQSWPAIGTGCFVRDATSTSFGRDIRRAERTAKADCRPGRQPLLARKMGEVGLFC
jgi:hypothetical protein